MCISEYLKSYNILLISYCCRVWLKLTFQSCCIYILVLNAYCRPLLESASASPVNEQATHLLHGLETHSVLFVLHQSTSLASLEPREVLDLLQNSVTKQTDGEHWFLFSYSYIQISKVILVIEYLKSIILILHA